MTIREIKEQELIELKTLKKECFGHSFNNDYLNNIYNQNSYEFLGIYEKGKLAGYLITIDQFESLEIFEIAIGELFRKKGYAKELLLDLIKRKKLNLYLEVRESNEVAISFYKKFGFEEVSIRKNYYKNPKENAIIMTYKINDKLKGWCKNVECLLKSVSWEIWIKGDAS